jgi:hypothetical protein
MAAKPASNILQGGTRMSGGILLKVYHLAIFPSTLIHSPLAVRDC